MKNFVYLIGDAKTREAVVVDAAWDVKVSVLLKKSLLNGVYSVHSIHFLS
jgi:hypothetical protein